MATVTVGKPEEFPEGEIRVVEVAEERVVVCRVQGQFYAFEDRCSHDDGSLDGGNLDGCEIECPRHGARFDVRTGQALCMPAVVPIATFAVQAVGDELQVTVED